MAESEAVATAPYVPYATFKNQVRKWGSGPFPSQIDPSILGTMSGGARSQFMTALKYFGLIVDEAEPTDELRRLAKASEQEFGKAMKPLLTRCYSAEQLDALARGTPASLANSFTGMSSSVTRKACRFFVTAAQEAGLEVSQYLLDGRGRIKGFGSNSRKNGRTRTKRPAEKEEAPAPVSPSQDLPSAPPNVRSWTFELPSGGTAELRWPNDISDADIKALWPQIDALKFMLEAQAQARAQRS